MEVKGVLADLRPSQPVKRPVLVPQGATYKITADGTYIVDTGAGGTTTLVMPHPDLNVSDIYVKNKSGSTVQVEPNTGTVNGSRSMYTMTNRELWLVATERDVWYVKLDETNIASAAAVPFLSIAKWLVD